MNPKAVRFPEIRLAVGAGLSFILLLRVLFFDDSWRDFPPSPIASCHRHTINPAGALVTAALSLFIVINLSPVAYRGALRDRWLAAGLAVFPFRVFLLTALGLL